jgi:predicted Ser/Thr protein kinase
VSELNSLCPRREALERFLLGRSDDAETIAIEEHLAACPACEERLATLHASDAVVDLLRATPSVSGEAAFVEELVERVCRQTRASAPAERQTPACVDPADFLDPPQGPGELGRLGPYRVLQLLGEGGMGVVFQAEDIELQRTVALKVLKPALAVSETARRRFLREARSAAALEHEHVVAIYHVGQDHSRAFLAMQLLRGETLEDRLRNTPRLPLTEIVRIGRETALGLAAAHEKRLIHRDVKPANVWLEVEGGRVKIVDFGLARAIDDDSQLTAAGVVTGTPSYMSPEQARGIAVDHRADLFSLGCVLYRMCAGQLPFRGETTLATLRAVEECQPASLSESHAEIPARLSALVTRLLEKEPRRRPRSAREVAAELEAIAQQVETGAGLAPARHSLRGWPLTLTAVALAGVAALAWRTFAPTLRSLPADAHRAPHASNTAPAQSAAPRSTLVLPGQRPLAAEYAHCFRGAAFDPRRLLPLGFDSLYGFTLLKPEPEGLRITIPPHESRQKPYLGLAPACEIRGDFQILASYDLLSATPAQTGSGTGANLYLLLKGTQRGFALRRCVLPPGQTFVRGTQQAYVIQFPVPGAAEGQRSEWKYFRASGNSGCLGLARTGTTLRYLVAEGEPSAWRALADAQIDPGPIGLLRVEAVVDREGAAVDMRWKDLLILAEQLEWADLRLLNPQTGSALNFRQDRPQVQAAWRPVARLRAQAIGCKL